jgi:hypothetical protein
MFRLKSSGVSIKRHGFDKRQSRGSACIYERSSAIKYAIGISNKLFCRLCNDPFHVATPLIYDMRQVRAGES